MSKFDNFTRNNEKRINDRDLKTDLLDKIEKGGLNYIKKEQSYLKISAFFPIYSLIINIINVIFIILGAILFRIGYYPPVSFEHELTSEQLIIVFLHISIPFCAFFIISIFSLIQFIFLRKWKHKITKYYKYENANSKNKGTNLNIESEVKSEGNITLTDLFYDIVGHMEKIRVLFILINIFSFFYLLWSFRFFVAIAMFLIKDMIRIFEFLYFLNLSGAFVLILFLIYMWYHFRRWNKKLKLLKKYEQKIAKELDL